LSIGDVIRRLNEMKGEKYKGPIWPDPTAELELVQLADDVSAIESEDADEPVNPHAVSAEQFAAILAEPEATIATVALQEDEQPKPGLSPVTIVVKEETPQLKYPELAFPIDELPAGRLRDLVDNASGDGLDPGLTCPAIMAIASSLPAYTEMDGDRIGLYVCLLGLVGAGKDVAMKRAVQLLGVEEGKEVRHYTPNGERAVAIQMGDAPGKKGEPRKPGPARLCMITPEMEETLKKSKAETGGVLQALQYFYDYSYKTVSDSRNGDNININCRLSWLTALPVGKHEIDRTAFKAAFGEGAGHGLASRMLFGFSERRIDPRKIRKWVPLNLNSKETVTENVDGIGPVTKEKFVSLKSSLLTARVDGFESPDVESLYENWAPTNDFSGRDFQHVHKVAINAALLNDHKQITRADWDFAVAFMEWQGRLRCMFTTGTARMTTLGEFNEIVLDETMRRIKKRLAPGGKDNKSVKVVATEGNSFVYVRWRGMPRSMPMACAGIKPIRAPACASLTWNTCNCTAR
jgi:hypothetical protein